MDYHPVSKHIVNLLADGGFWYETFEHQPVRTSEEAAATRPGYTLQHGAKAIIVRIRKSEADRRLVMLVFPAHLRFDKDKVKATLGAKDIRFASEEEVVQVTGGVKPGGVPPFGNLFNLEVFADPRLFENERIVFNAGDPAFSVAMRSRDYAALVKPLITPIT